MKAKELIAILSQYEDFEVLLRECTVDDHGIVIDDFDLIKLDIGHSDKILLLEKVNLYEHR